MRVLVLDNYDSFTWNLVHLLEERGAEVHVHRNDAITVEEAAALRPDRLVVSPGPGRPKEAGLSLELIRALGPEVPTLGVCLGHQAIVEAFGGSVGQARSLLHGRRASYTTTDTGSSPACPRRSRSAATTRSRLSRFPTASWSPPAPTTVRSWECDIARIRSRAFSSTRSRC
jgi:anthranilate synthase component 2